MTPEQFAHWLQGCFELTDTNTLDEKQVAVIKEHLSLAIDKRTSQTVVKTFCAPSLQLGRIC